MSNQQPTDPRLEAELLRRRQMAQQQAVQQQQIYYLLRVPPGHEIRPIRSVTKGTLVIAAAIVIAGLLISLAILFSPLYAPSNSNVDVGELKGPALLLPEENSVVQSDEIALYWTPVLGADNYTLVVGGSSSSYYFNTSINDTHYSISGLSDSETYWWKVAAVRDGRYGPFSSYRPFTVMTHLDTPSSPSPGNGSVYAAEIPTLQWASVNGASEYRLQLSEKSNYSSLLLDVLTSTNVYTLDVEMKDNATYYWRVMAHEGSIWSGWSESNSFVRDIVVLVPSPTGPSQTLTALKLFTNLTWSPINDADYYHVQISKVSSFSSLVVNSTVETTRYQLPSSIQDNSTYYWRVQAEQDGMWSAWSPAWHFYLGHSSLSISISWTYGGISWTLIDTVPGSDYYPYHDRTRNYNYASYVTDDKWVETIASKLDQMADAKSYSTYQEAEFVLKFVQSIPYALDINTAGQEEYPRYSLETLVDHVGDCEDLAALYASLMQSSSIHIDTVLLKFTKTGASGHMATGVAGNGLPGTYFVYSGVKYYYCETTNSSYSIGVYPTSTLDGYTCTVLPC
jgi:hypothetical protein